MSVMFHRLLVVLIFLWFLRHIDVTFMVPDEGRALWGAVTAIWGLSAIYLIVGRRVELVWWVVLALIGLEFAVMGWWNREGVSMLGWMVLIVALTERRPSHERAVLLRACVTVVYSFAVLTKLNPSWLGGEGVVSLPALHPPLAWLGPILSTPGVPAVGAVMVVFIEAFLAVGLWMRRTRMIAAVVGGAVHLVFVVALSRSFYSFAHLMMLNGGLVLCYLAFWAPIEPEAGEDRTPTVEGMAVPAGIMVSVRTRAPSHSAGHVPDSGVHVSS